MSESLQYGRFNLFTNGLYTTDLIEDLWDKEEGSALYQRADGTLSVQLRQGTEWKQKSFTFDEILVENDLNRGLTQDWKDLTRVFHRFESLLKIVFPCISFESKPPNIVLPKSQFRKRGYLKVLPPAVKRVVGLFYLLVQFPCLENVAVYLDSIETLLHPRQQRRILPLLCHNRIRRLFVVTNSPLVLASMEPFFESNKDILIKNGLDYEEGYREEYAPGFRCLGDASVWLTKIFGLEEPRCEQVEKILVQARKAMKEPRPNYRAMVHLTRNLGHVLPDTDPFWVRWLRVLDRCEIKE